MRIPVADAATVVFILGRDGSFAALRLAGDDVTAVTLAAPASFLRITTRTTLGKPLPGVAMLIAYGCEVLPLEVAPASSTPAAHYAPTEEATSPCATSLLVRTTSGPAPATPKPN